MAVSKKAIFIPENQEKLEYYSGFSNKNCIFVESFGSEKTASYERFPREEPADIFEYDPRQLGHLDRSSFAKCYESGGLVRHQVVRCPVHAHTWIGVDLGRALANRKWLLGRVWDDKRPSVRRNLLLLLILDISLGCFLSSCLPADSESYLGSKTWVDRSATQLAMGLEWIADNPGGMKLNPKMAELISKFCYHHVQIWNGYARMVIDNREKILIAAKMLSPLGVSFTFALLSDMFMVMSLHFYCFYVYGLRLYRFWVVTLIHLLNLLFGKKSNPLMQCRDSIFTESEDSASEATKFRLTVGSLLFAVFTFLFPTVVLYYCCFCLIRIIQLGIRSVLREITDSFVNSYPIYYVQSFFRPWDFGVNLKIFGSKAEFEPISMKQLLSHSLVSNDDPSIFTSLIKGYII